MTESRGDDSALLLVVNPRSRAAGGAPAGSAIAALLASRPGTRVIETRGDGTDTERIAAALRDVPATGLVAAAGGDGTAREAAQAILDVTGGGAAAPALAVVPLGTANNFARALGLASLRSGGDAEADRAVRAALAGRDSMLDLGSCGEDCFIGSFAIGMDADILVLRNAIRRRLRLTGDVGGYPLYLACCALSLARRRAVEANVAIDDLPAERRHIYSLLVTTTPLYAGEFRFVAASSPDGKLDLHRTETAPIYVGEYARAWRRHVNFERGAEVAASTRVRSVTRLEVELDREQSAQVDGEELPARRRWSVRVLPGALRVRVAI